MSAMRFAANRFKAAMVAIRDRRAVTMVEFALVGPLFMLAMLFMFSVGFYFFVQETVDYAVRAGARQLAIGVAQNATVVNAQGETVWSGPTTAAQFKTAYVCPYLAGLLSCNNLQLAVSVVPAGQDFVSYTNNPSPADPSAASPLAGGPSLAFCNGVNQQVLLLQAAYMMPVWLGFLFPYSQQIDSNGFITRRGTTVWNSRRVFPIIAAEPFSIESFSQNKYFTSAMQAQGNGQCS